MHLDAILKKIFAPVSDLIFLILGFFMTTLSISQQTNKSVSEDAEKKQKVSKFYYTIKLLWVV